MTPKRLDNFGSGRSLIGGWPCCSLEDCLVLLLLGTWAWDSARLWVSCSNLIWIWAVSNMGYLHPKIPFLKILRARFWKLMQTIVRIFRQITTLSIVVYGYYLKVDKYLGWGPGCLLGLAEALLWLLRWSSKYFFSYSSVARLRLSCILLLALLSLSRSERKLSSFSSISSADKIPFFDEMDEPLEKPALS